MPFVDISLAQGKSREYLEGVSNAVTRRSLQSSAFSPGTDSSSSNSTSPMT